MSRNVDEHHEYASTYCIFMRKNLMTLLTIEPVDNLKTGCISFSWKAVGRASEEKNHKFENNLLDKKGSKLWPYSSSENSFR